MVASGQDRPPPGHGQMPSVPTGPALHHEPTATAVHSYRRRALRTLVVGVVLMAGVLRAGHVVQSGAKELLRTGQRVPGRVVEVKKHDIVVSYEAEGRSRRATMKVGDAGATFRVGQTMELIYDPDDPERVRTSDDANILPATVLLLVSTGAGAAWVIWIGLRGLVRASRFRQILAGNSWRAVRYRYMVGHRPGSEPVVAVQDGDQREILRVDWSREWDRTPERREWAPSGWLVL